MKKKKKQTVKHSKLIADTDALASIYTRLKNADSNGNIKCYTCDRVGNVQNGRGMNNGHYVTRAVKLTRWDTNNMRPQCFMCNGVHGGNKSEYKRRLQNEIGAKAVADLDNVEQLHINHARDEKFTNSDLCDLILMFVQMIKKLNKRYLLTENQNKMIDRAEKLAIKLLKGK